LAIERAEQLDRPRHLRRQVVDAVHAHQVAPRDQREIVEANIGLIPIGEANGVSLRERTVGRFPDDQVHGAPTALQR
jgi:hypothetical protein